MGPAASPTGRLVQPVRQMHTPGGVWGQDHYYSDSLANPWATFPYALVAVWPDTVMVTLHLQAPGSMENSAYEVNETGTFTHRHIDIDTHTQTQTKNELFCLIHKEMYFLACNRHLLFSQSRMCMPGSQAKGGSQKPFACHVQWHKFHKQSTLHVNCVPPLAHSARRSTPKWPLVGGCRRCKLAHTLTCTP